MDVADLFEFMPYVRDLGVEVTEAADGRARGRLALAERHSSTPHRLVAHGGVTYALADTVAGAAVISLYRMSTPTVDMRIDYLAPATADLTAEAEVVRDGGSVAVAEVDVEDADGTRVATARGVYKTGEPGDETAWGASDADALAAALDDGDSDE